MRIPILFGSVTREAELTPGKRDCPHCATATVHSARRVWTYVTVYWIPVKTTRESCAYTCSRCGQVSQGPTPPGAPPLPFMHRLGWAAALAVIFLGPPVVMTPLMLRDQARHRVLDAEREQDGREASATRERALQILSRATQAREACLAEVEAARRAVAVLGVKSMLPRDPAALERTGFVSIDRGEASLPRPLSRFTWPAPCALDTPVELDKVDLFLSTRANRLRVEAVAALFAHQAAALQAPTRLVLGDCACGAERCRGALVWISLPEQRVLAAVATTVNSRFKGRPPDPYDVARALAKATEALSTPNVARAASQ